MNFAVFSDVHGRILLAFALCARWEHKTGERIDLILQAGDLGAFPDATGLDRATIQHARADATELGFLMDFVAPRPDVAATLSATRTPLIFVRGNHEDHAWLDTLEAQAANAALFPIDAYERIFCLKTGMPYTMRDEDQKVCVLGIGRIGAPGGEREPMESKQTESRYIQSYERQRLHQLRAPACDILLTHDAAHATRRGGGMQEIRTCLDRHQPAYHFYGHTEQPFQRHLDRNGVTTAIRLADLHWERRGPRTGMLPPGVMGILRWQDREHHAFAVVDEPWLADYCAWNWRETAQQFQASAPEA